MCVGGYNTRAYPDSLSDYSWQCLRNTHAAGIKLELTVYKTIALALYCTIPPHSPTPDTMISLTILAVLRT